MLALLIYCYANGLFSSRRSERATYRDAAVRSLTADPHPDHDTIRTFRRQNLEAIAASFVDVLELARELKLLQLGTVSLDGTHLKASAFKDKNVTCERAQQLRAQLRLDAQALLAQAEAADRTDDDPQRLPKEIARREQLLQKTDAACAQLEARAHARAALADCGFANKEVFQRLATERPALDLYVSVHREDAHAERRYDWRPLAQIKPPKTLTDPMLLAMAAKLKTDEGKARYRKRACTVEPVFGIIKAVLGFRQFLLRGLKKVAGEWNLVCLAYNLKRLHTLRMAAVGA
jgi:hypothetical protein